MFMPTHISICAMHAHGRQENLFVSKSIAAGHGGRRARIGAFNRLWHMPKITWESTALQSRKTTQIISQIKNVPFVKLLCGNGAGIQGKQNKTAKAMGAFKVSATLPAMALKSLRSGNTDMHRTRQVPTCKTLYDREAKIHNKTSRRLARGITRRPCCEVLELHRCWKHRPEALVPMQQKTQDKTRS